MDLRAYQTAAAATDLLTQRGAGDPTVPLLGLAGEVGEMQSEYKKALRDGPLSTRAIPIRSGSRGSCA